MEEKSKIRVLVVDDSLMYRNVITQGLEKDPVIEVVGTAANTYEARDKILSLKPDVVTLDAEMPGMNGLSFLKILKAQHPVPVVMVSAVEGIVFEAMKAGAVDFVAKPEASSVALFLTDLAAKVRIASGVKIRREEAGEGAKGESAAALRNRVSLLTLTERNLPTTGVIAIGASTGGTEATSSILKLLPVNLPPIVVTQHMPQGFTRLYAERLNKESRFTVTEAADGMVLQPGRVYVAEGGRQMRIRKSGSGYAIALGETELNSGHCPSVNILFESVAKVAGESALGILLTGMGADGAKGLLQMKEAGAYTIGQDERSCIVYGMPQEAYKMGAVTRQASLENIPNVVVNYLIKKKLGRA